MANVSMRRMLEAGVHFGHQTRYWNPRMAPFIFGERSKIHIINLEKTVPLFEEATNFLSKLASKGGQVLFVGTKRAARDAVEREASRAGMPYVSQRWLGGTLTNFATIRHSVRRLLDLEAMAEDGTLDRLVKKETVKLNREHAKLQKSLGGIRNMESLPDALFVVDVGYERIAVHEAVKLGIPVVGIVDSNNSPNGVEYVIPGNDDAISAIELYTGAAADAILTGKESVPVIEGDAEDFVEEEEVERIARRRSRSAKGGAKPRENAGRSATATDSAEKAKTKGADEVAGDEAEGDAGEAADATEATEATPSPSVTEAGSEEGEESA